MKKYNFKAISGILAFCAILCQIITGIFLSLHYEPNTEKAFYSVTKISNYNQIIRKMHVVGTTVIFALVYLHLMLILYNRSYKKYPNAWRIGCFILLVILTSAFTGQILPWGQASYWGLVIFSNIMGVIPFIGQELAILIMQDENTSLNKYFILHCFLPLLIISFTIAHIFFKKRFAINKNKIQQLKKTKKINWLSYLIVSFIIITYLSLYHWKYFLNPLNEIAANSLITPENINVEWYFAPFYNILLAISPKSLGIFTLFASITLLFLLPELDFATEISKKKSIWHKVTCSIFICNYCFLSYMKTENMAENNLILARIAISYYFIHLLIILPIINRFIK